MRFLKPALLSVIGATWISGAIAAAVPSKNVKIFNNTGDKLYAVIETSPSDTDQWLQAAFGTTNVKRDTYAHTKVYRVYINPDKGIPPGGSITIKVPFYSQLVQNPDATKPDQYIDWWNGGRVDLYDVHANLVLRLNADQKNAVVPLTAGVSCARNSTCEPLNVYSGTVVLPLEDPTQLTEYTFANVITNQGTPYPLDPTYVDYDISYVDQVYLPVAIEPLNNKYIGYSGTTQAVPDFRKELKNFLGAWQGWPIYVGNPVYPNPRIPGAYNVMIGGSGLTDPGVTVKQMKDLYKNCVKKDDGTDICRDIRAVNNLFQKNYAKYLTQDCNPHVELTDDRLLQHVYGWAAFKEYCKDPHNELADTPGIDYQATFSNYIELQYLASGAFNPYVQLIHGTNYLGMNAYAFSVDDAVGNMNELGDGLILAVGGNKGLANKKAFDKHKIIHVNLQTPGKDDPKWKSYGICTATPTQNLTQGFLSFTIYTVNYPCQIAVSDANGKIYDFTIKNEPPDPVINCRKSGTPDWCKAAVVNKDPVTGWNINTTGTQQ